MRITSTIWPEESCISVLKRMPDLERLIDSAGMVISWLPALATNE
jgi:hypothetical protein